MRTILNTAHVYMILGLVSGLYYRELTKATGFTGETQLGVVHTHLLALGMLFFLIVLALDKLFALTGHPLFRWFFGIYNTGLAITIGAMTLKGTLTVLGHDAGEPLALVAGLGHILLTVGLVLLFVTLGKLIPAKARPEVGSDGAEAAAVTPR